MEPGNNFEPGHSQCSDEPLILREELEEILMKKFGAKKDEEILQKWNLEGGLSIFYQTGEDCEIKIKHPEDFVYEIYFFPVKSKSNRYLIELDAYLLPKNNLQF